MDKNKPEKKALIAAALINFLMAIAGWFTFYISNAQALLLDGNFSFIAFISTLIALFISKVKAKKTEVFPFGQFVYEALFSFSKGIMIIGILIVALTENILRIFHYVNGDPLEPLKTGPILIYALLMVILCWFLAFYCHYQNKKINFSSTLLRAEYAGAKVDAFMSLAAGLALFGIGFVNIEGNFGFLHYIGDALLVVILVLLLGKEPFILVRQSFIELAGGILQNQQEKKNIEMILETHLDSNHLLKQSYISKTGSSYLIIAYIDLQKLAHSNYENLSLTKEKIIKKLNEDYPNTLLEFVLI